MNNEEEMNRWERVEAKRQKLEEEKRMKKEHDMEIRRRNVAMFFRNFTEYFLPWLHELTRRYKERGEFPVMACWLLPSYYTYDLDIEIAAYCALLIKDDEKVMERVGAFRELLTDRPFEWFRARGFVPLSIGESREKLSTGGVKNYGIAVYLSDLYDNWRKREQMMPEILSNRFDEDHVQERLATLRLVLGTSDGFGQGVCAVAPQDLRCPLRRETNRLLKTFMPDYVKMHDKEEAIRLFGFEHDHDFFYAALAWQELSQRDPYGCHRLATVYNKRYSESNILDRRYWDGSRKIFPEITF